MYYPRGCQEAPPFRNACMTSNISRPRRPLLELEVGLARRSYWVAVKELNVSYPSMGIYGSGCKPPEYGYIKFRV